MTGLGLWKLMIKNALILHGTGADHSANWFPWLKEELEKIGYRVWVPDLPNADKPNTNRYNEYIFSNKEFEIGKDTIIIGHSSGAVEILGLLQGLGDRKIKAAYLVGSFKDNLGRDDLSELFLTPFDFEKIKNSSSTFVFFHSDNDPYCPLDHAKYLCDKVNGELIVISGQKHFSISTVGEEYKKFPKLLEKIIENE